MFSSILRTTISVLIFLAVGFITQAQEEIPDVCPSSLEPNLAIGQSAIVTTDNILLTIRQEPTINSPRIAQLSDGTELIIVDGYICANGYTWWQIESNDITGWAAQGDNEDYWLEVNIDATQVRVEEDNLYLIEDWVWELQQAEGLAPFWFGCDTTDCAEFDSIDMPAEMLDWNVWDVTIDADNLPVITYSSVERGLQLARCLDFGCEERFTVTLQPADETQAIDPVRQIVVAVNDVNLPTVTTTSFFDDDISIYRCEDVTCENMQSQTISGLPPVANKTLDLVISNRDIPYLGYVADNSSLGVIIDCETITCETPRVIVAPDGNRADRIRVWVNAFGSPSLAVAGDDLRIIQCATLGCTEPQNILITNDLQVDTALPAISFDAGGVTSIFYHERDAEALQMLTCVACPEPETKVIHNDIGAGGNIRVVQTDENQPIIRLDNQELALPSLIVCETSACEQTESYSFAIDPVPELETTAEATPELEVTSEVTVEPEATPEITAEPTPEATEELGT